MAVGFAVVAVVVEVVLNVEVMSWRSHVCDECSLFGSHVNAIHKGLISLQNNYQVGLMVNCASLTSRWVAGSNLSVAQF